MSNITFVTLEVIAKQNTRTWAKERSQIQTQQAELRTDKIRKGQIQARVWKQEFPCGVNAAFSGNKRILTKRLRTTKQYVLVSLLS